MPEKYSLKRILAGLKRHGLRGLIHFVLRRAGIESDQQWCRIVMDEETSRLVKELGPQELNVLEISGTKWAGSAFKGYRTASYPEFDVCSSQLDQRFDLIIAEQVWEHLLWPYRATKNVYGMLNVGGYFLLTTPFLIRVHDYPTDCSRWTETGIKHLLIECGFLENTIRTGSWGNRKCVVGNFKSFVSYNRLWHSLSNEADFPLVVWGLAKKETV